MGIFLIRFFKWESIGPGQEKLLSGEKRDLLAWASSRGSLREGGSPVGRVWAAGVTLMGAGGWL